jgi:predicted ATPase
MIFHFKNFGPIKEAKIELAGITILTGLNDTGKSFLGKCISSIIKTISEADNFNRERRYETFSTSINIISTHHRQNVPYTPDRSQKFNTQSLNQAFANYLYSFADRQPQTSDMINGQVTEFTTNVLRELEQAKVTTGPPFHRQLDNAIKHVQANLNILKSVIHTNDTEEKKYKTYFDLKVIQGLFQSQMNSLSGDSKLEIVVNEGVTNLLKIEVVNNTTTLFEVYNPILLRDSVVIETPTIIQLENFIANSMAFFGGRERADLPVHYIDLIQKLRVPSLQKSGFQKITTEIKNIISGQFKVAEQGGSIVYVKDKHSIKGANIASGIKSFGILQLLIDSYLNAGTLLVIDEPEVHLHPKWVIDYVQIITLLCKAGVPILISSHSPYLIETLYRIKEHQGEGMQDKIGFYFGTKDQDGGTQFENVTKDITPIFEALADPLRTRIRKQ